MAWRLREQSLTRQLAITLVVSVAALVVATLTVSTWLITTRLETFAHSSATSVVRRFSEETTFALLVANEDPSVAERAIATMASYPGVEYVAMLDTELKPVASRGERDSTWPQPATLIKTPWARPDVAATDTEAAWHYLAPVVVRPARNPLEGGPATPERVGYIHMVVAKAPIRGVVRTIAYIETALAAALTLLILAWLMRRVRSLSEPLRGLANVMREGELSPPDLEAAPEVKQVAAVYNRLMEEVYRRRASLESEVAMRTEDLRVARDAALSAERYKTEFMAAITHEMKAPLQAINAYVEHTLSELEFLKDEAATDKARQYLAIVMQSSGDLLFRINQILDLTRAQAGKHELKLEEVDIEDLLAHLENTVRPLARANDNELEISQEGDGRLVIDEDKLFHVMLNPVTNACKFTRGGEVAVRVTREDGRLRVTVRDNGIGIHPDKQALVFEPFRQADMSATRAYEGTGLGLAITKSFCELMGGNVSLKSTVGEGTTVTITIPLPVAGSSHS